MMREAKYLNPGAGGHGPRVSPLRALYPLLTHTSCKGRPRPMLIKALLITSFIAMIVFPMPLEAVIDISGTMQDVGGTRTVQRSFVDVTLSGDTEAIPAQGVGNRIRVLGIYCQSALAVALKLKSTGANVISATFAVATNGTLSMPYNPHGWMETNPNEALVLNQSLAVSTGCQFIWIRAT